MLGDDDEGGEGSKRAALLIGFGGGDEEESSSGPGLMRALGRAIRKGDFERAWSVFEEAYAACGDSKKGGDEGGDRYEGKGDDDGDELTF